jgi:hypothetical protein
MYRAACKIHGKIGAFAVRVRPDIPLLLRTAAGTVYTLHSVFTGQPACLCNLAVIA